jgi:glycosyltransferase involved in cell wall biosynthesis
MIDCRLPRLLYLSDVPVEASYHGSALLYRLLEEYPKDRLMIVEAGIGLSAPQRRIAGVAYADMRLPFTRLQATRFASLYESARLSAAKAHAMLLKHKTASFGTEAVITVSHGTSWIAAAWLARQLSVPLHLICHDEWANAAGSTKLVWRERVFGDVYRQANSRLCVSPFMAEDYERRFGVPGLVLYPSRAASTPRFDAPSEHLGRGVAAFTYAFAGTINSKGIVGALRRLASCLAAFGGRLLIYGPLTTEQARADGLDEANVELCGLLPSEVLMTTLRERADALFVPMSFAAADRPNMQVSFPSKLTDYTAVGLPLLIYGPEYCSAVRWARDNAGVAEVVAAEGGEELADAVARLSRDPGRRIRLAHAALDAGERYFSHGAAKAVLKAALRDHGRRGVRLCG